MEKISILLILAISIFIIPTVAGWLHGRNNKTPEQLRQESGQGEWS